MAPSPNLTRAPKDQIESYDTPPSGRLFKGQSHNATHAHAFSNSAKGYTAHEDFKHVTRGRATEVK